MIVIVQEIEIPILHLFLFDPGKAACKVDRKSFVFWLDKALNSEVNRRRPQGVAHVEVRDGDRPCLDIIVFRSDGVLMYPDSAGGCSLMKLRECMPDWLWESLEEINGMKVNWSEGIK